MVMDIGEGCNPARLPAWFVQGKDRYTPQIPKPEKGLIHQDSTRSNEARDILWALDDRGIFTLFEGSQGFERQGVNKAACWSGCL